MSAQSEEDGGWVNNRVYRPFPVAEPWEHHLHKQDFERCAM